MKPRSPIAKQSKKRLAAIADGTYKPKPKTPIAKVSKKRQAVLDVNPYAFKKIPQKIREVKITDTDRAGLIKKLDSLFSKHIRNKYAINGIVKCFTCPTKKPVAQMQNGHYISRANMGTRFMEDNCKPQCEKCNNYHEINILVFKEALEAEDFGITGWLELYSRKPTSISTSELIDLIEKYKT